MWFRLFFHVHRSRPGTRGFSLWMLGWEIYGNRKWVKQCAAQSKCTFYFSPLPPLPSCPLWVDECVWLCVSNLWVCQVTASLHVSLFVYVEDFSTSPLGSSSSLSPVFPQHKYERDGEKRWRAEGEMDAFFATLTLLFVSNNNTSNREDQSYLNPNIYFLPLWNGRLWLVAIS